MYLLIEEIIVLLFILISVPAFVYALGKLTKRKLFNKKWIVLLYALIFYIFFMNAEKIMRNIKDDYKLIIPGFKSELLEKE
ncbi:MAG: hypothetical protein A2Y03_00900 [Omnitrophica WOR_2 bacterium GWF2_38_59]|nr:MAG: hypothetical protein A2Y06_03470 [Omnitrophica WOR_2 bacterium GWA2_37_7]OGX24001.1 MAG: hypothetical protein A2Y03_00900 [Omnitrophica WOR_2 bacterium GWF2_38_59]OGX46913.1 MAG: hypothetical protein A2243_12020 [Omnitrophica WOR_2 bacterium RIFOXYA2_FULL_38_17]OGX52478.1 MAG: hypothetical protein A2267_05310 [Omnitrophica WOR_2 bacterium RIFOXYA12_FULL_38_10]OGX56493.1 MAG: hypothetical protein A2447_10205 [Omnitrophica WOR_2 bacterium RIFOXYC2_FULL_38_12]OGX58381.1 MAG: hypothetical 